MLSPEPPISNLKVTPSRAWLSVYLACCPEADIVAVSAAEMPILWVEALDFSSVRQIGGLT